jgi:hypothetical protein
MPEYCPRQFEGPCTKTCGNLSGGRCWAGHTVEGCHALSLPIEDLMSSKERIESLERRLAEYQSITPIPSSQMDRVLRELGELREDTVTLRTSLIHLQKRRRKESY